LNTTLNYEISAMWEMKPEADPQKTFWLVMEPEQVTRPNTMQATWWYLF